MGVGRTHYFSIAWDYVERKESHLISQLADTEDFKTAHTLVIIRAVDTSRSLRSDSYESKYKVATGL